MTPILNVRILKLWNPAVLTRFYLLSFDYGTTPKGRTPALILASDCNTFARSADTRFPLVASAHRSIPVQAGRWNGCAQEGHWRHGVKVDRGVP
ncbi:MAG: hypothetical protein ACXWNC_10010, partial [Anaerolineales bacterium]